MFVEKVDWWQALGSRLDNGDGLIGKKSSKAGRTLATSILRPLMMWNSLGRILLQGVLKWFFAVYQSCVTRFDLARALLQLTSKVDRLRENIRPMESAAKVVAHW